MSNFQLSDVSTIDYISTLLVDANANRPQGISYANSDNLWFCDNTTNKIYNITNSGTAISSFSTTDIDSLATDPRGMTYTSSDNIWFCDGVQKKVYNCTTDGSSLISFFLTTLDGLRGVSFTTSNNLWLADNDGDRVYNLTTDGSSVISFFSTTGVDSLATGISDVSYSNSDNVWFLDNNANKVYNTTTDGSSLISFFLTTDVDSVMTIPSGITYTTSDNLWLCGTNTDKIYNTTTSGTLLLAHAGDVNRIDINPEYDYQFTNNMVNRQDMRTKEGSLFTYIENGRFREFKLPISWINSSDVSQVGSWWGVGTDLRFRENSDFPSSFFNVRIMGEEDPFNTYIRPYFQEFYSGEIVLETT